jgi:hypothetical protein
MQQKQFIEESAIPAKLARAVVRQMGGWDCFKESAEDVTNHGASAGVSGFIYYSETLPFAKKHRADIAKLVEQLADEIGEDVIAMVKCWRCMEDATTAEIAAGLYGRGDDTQVLNGLAWFALEETCRAYDNALQYA